MATYKSISICTQDIIAFTNRFRYLLLKRQSYWHTRKVSFSSNTRSIKYIKRTCKIRQYPVSQFQWRQPWRQHFWKDEHFSAPTNIQSSRWTIDISIVIFILNFMFYPQTSRWACERKAYRHLSKFFHTNNRYWFTWIFQDAHRYEALFNDTIMTKRAANRTWWCNSQHDLISSFCRGIRVVSVRPCLGCYSSIEMDDCFLLLFSSMT